MKEIEISTTQNVNIEYKLATFWERFVSYLIDLVILFVSGGLFLIVYVVIYGTGSMNFFLQYILIPFLGMYSLFFEIFNEGRSLGKMIMGLRVVKIDGFRISINDYITRWIFRIIDIWSTLGAVGSFLISSSRKHQRLGDILANTTVIHYKPDYTFNLSTLVNRKSVADFEPKYPEVRKFREEEMLLLKNVIERYRKYPNTAHQEALDMLTAKVLEQLGVRERPQNKIAFLESVLKEYILLTR
jgi:uncharacterized RDD family membrane protein YckC